MNSAPASRRMPLVVVCVVAMFVIGIGYGVFIGVSKLQPVSAVAATIDVPKPTVVPLAWPSYGIAALSVAGTNLMLTNGEQAPRPIASIAKIVLALSLLKEKPLDQGQTGPTITFTEADVDLYRAELARNGSVVPIAAGEEVTLYQALQALLLPSGNNIAQSLAIWAFGSTDGYLTYANKLVADLGLTQTHLADPSGFSPETVSSARDLVILGQAVLKEPSLADIVSQSEATLPVVGAVQNINSILGEHDIVGIKTGNTDEAGGCLLFASKGTAANGGAMIIGAILGAPDLATVLQDTNKILETNRSNFQPIVAVKAGQPVAIYTAPWGTKATAVAERDLVVYSPNGEAVTISSEATPVSIPANNNDVVGSVTATIGDVITTVPVALSAQISKPSFIWRLLHPTK